MLQKSFAWTSSSFPFVLFFLASIHEEMKKLLLEDKSRRTGCYMLRVVGMWHFPLTSIVAAAFESFHNFVSFHAIFSYKISNL